MQKKRNMQVFFPYAILVFRIFWKKTVYRNQICEIEQRKKELTLVSRGMKRNCINNCPLKPFILNIFGESRVGTQIGNLKGKVFWAKNSKSVQFGSFLDPERETEE